MCRTTPLTHRYDSLPETLDETFDDEAEIAPPADAAEALDRLRDLFAECEIAARRFFGFAQIDGIDFDIRCAYAGLAGRLVRTAGGIAGRLERAERAASAKPSRS